VTILSFTDLIISHFNRTVNPTKKDTPSAFLPKECFLEIFNEKTSTSFGKSCYLIFWVLIAFTHHNFGDDIKHLLVTAAAAG
jgi:hypothetical protein